tara:strand:- start:115 stop:288 length:174 start_codon:yes stop_codon:yes gene_type:complete
LKIKGVNVDGLSKSAIAKLKKHAEHHTPTHIRLMVKEMKQGVSFEQAHEYAMQDVGY